MKSSEMSFMQKRAKCRYAVKIGKKLYLRDSNGRTTTDPNKAERYSLALVDWLARLAEEYGGRVVRFRVKCRLVVTREIDDSRGEGGDDGE